MTTITNEDGSTIDVVYTPAPVVPPVPVPEPFVVGDTPWSAAGGAAEVDKQFGVKSKIMRIFFSGALAVAPYSDRECVGSFKTGMPTADVLKTYKWATKVHEVDAKDIKSQQPGGVPFDFPGWQNDMRDLVAMGTGNVCVILTGDCATNPDKNLDKYIIEGVTRYYFDLDGISPKAGESGYHDYTATIAAIVAWCKKHGFTWGVAEMGANRSTLDLVGTNRAQWLTKLINQCRAAGATDVMVWAWSGMPNSAFNMPAEIAAIHTAMTLAA
jgi:hypothetical protein